MCTWKHCRRGACYLSEDHSAARPTEGTTGRTLENRSEYYISKAQRIPSETAKRGAQRNESCLDRFSVSIGPQHVGSICLRALICVY